jgi:hypothetical protein
MYLITVFQYHLIVGCGVPISLAVLGILGKKISRGAGGGWKRTDFYLGVEFTLAGVATGLVNLFDLLLKPGRQLDPSDNKAILLNIFVAFGGMLSFMYVISLHQGYENTGHTGDARKRELRILAGLANIVGVLVLVAGAILSL